MSLKIFKNQEYEFTHENEQFRKLEEILKERFDKTDELNLLFANIYFGGVPLDALFVKHNAIIVLEFKNYTGELTAAENGDWSLSDGTKVKGGAGKNPFMQTRANKFSVLSELSTWFPRPYVNLGQISGVVVFNQPIKIVIDRISSKSKSWFHICDMDNIGNKLEDIASPGIKYTESDLLEFPRIVNCSDAYYESPVIRERPQIIEQPVIVQPVVQNVNTTLSDSVRRILVNNGYKIIENGEKEKPAKAAEYYQGEILLGKKTQEYIRTNYSGGLYKHQYEAAKFASDGTNVCIATSTSSGKTAIFHLAALEILEKDPEAKIIAVYPMKALGNQQVNSWNEKLQNVRCGRIDGNVKNLDQRLEILERCSVVTFTPDTIHTFLLGKLKDTRCSGIIRNFIRKLKLVIIDEVHLYRGMLGSNSAYMFRRLNACSVLAGGTVPQYITASATIEEPLGHSENITGASPFELIGPDSDSSPSCSTKIFFIKRGNGIINLLTLLNKNLPDNSRTITFVDNRQDVERIAREVDNATTLSERKMFSFRSGYEGEFYDETMDALQNNRFKGVISTSSLEVGIDIANLNVAILDGIPNSSTSYNQRIGRVGRGNTNNEAVVIIMDKPNSLNTYLAFKDPQGFSLPSEEPALYLKNKNLINIQALHFVGTGEEMLSVIEKKDAISEYERVRNFFPQEYNEVCLNVLRDQLQGLDGYDDVMNEGGEHPEFVFAVRNFDAQFDVYQTNNVDDSLEGLTIQNILREAYPGAIHICRNEAWRVKKVDKKLQTVTLDVLERQRSHNKTKADSRICVIPQKMSSILKHLVFGDLHLINLDIYEKTTITGFKEMDSHGNEMDRVIYRDRRPYYYDGDFKYTLPTTGVIFCHPSLNSLRQVSLIATLLYNCFLSRSAFERSDIENRAGTLNTEIDGIIAGTPFFTIYDKNTNGLNITERLMDHKVLLSGFKTMIEIIDNNLEKNFLGEKVTLLKETKDAIHTMYQELKNHEKPEEKGVSRIPDFHIARNSKAYYIKDLEEDVKEEVTITVVHRYDKDNSITYELEDSNGNDIEDEIPEEQVIAIPGVSYKAIFKNTTSHQSVNTGELW